MCGRLPARSADSWPVAHRLRANDSGSGFPLLDHGCLPGWDYPLLLDYLRRAAMELIETGLIPEPHAAALVASFELWIPRAIEADATGMICPPERLHSAADLRGKADARALLACVGFEPQAPAAPTLTEVAAPAPARSRPPPGGQPSKAGHGRSIDGNDSTPGISHGLDAGYRWFSRNRLRLTGRCDDRCAVPTAPASSVSSI